MPQMRAFESKYLVQTILLVIGIVSISLLAIQPFTLNKMPETADGILHLYRVAATDYSLKVDNPLWMRYSTGIVYGYGAPLFNYFPPLSYYLGSWLHTLGLTFVQSWLAMMALYTVISAFGMFLLGLIWTQSNVGGWVTAVAYIYAPYFLFDTVARGTSSEMGALAMLPFAFYGFTRLAVYGRRRDFWFAVIGFALFIPMHTIMTLHGTALLGVYCVFLWLTSDDKQRTFMRLLLAGGLALTITAFFWMPAILETDAVKINLIAENLNQIDVTRHLRPLDEILALPHTADPTQMAQPIPISLSVVQLILSLFGLVIAWNDRSPIYRNLLLMLWGVLLVLIFMNTPASAWLWENLPLIGYTQFPWRIMGLASLVLALMTGMSVWLSWAIVPAGWIKTGVFSVLTLLIITYSIPWTYSLYLDDIELNDIRDVHDFERETGQLTVSSYSEYLPVSTDESQLDPNRLIDRFEQDDIIPRLLDSDTVTILSADWGATSGDLKVTSLESQTLIFDWLYVEGWVATTDGQAVDVYPNIPQGLVAIDIPRGDFDLQISLQPTETQSTSVVISLLGVVGVIVVSLAWRFFSGFSNLHSLQIDPAYSIFAIVVAIGIGVFLFKAVILDNTDNQFKSTHFGDLSAETNEIVPLANFGNQIDLLDIEFPSSEYSSRLVQIKLYWQLHDMPIDAEYSSIVRIRDGQGIVMAESSAYQPGGLATNNWFESHYIVDTIELEIPPYVPLLESYTFDVGLFNAVTLEPLSIINNSGNPDGIGFEIHDPEFESEWSRRVQYGSRLQSIDAFQGYEKIGFYMSIGVNGLPDNVRVGDELVFDWTWQALSALYLLDDDDFYGQLIWRDSSLDVEFNSEMVPLVWDYPTRHWERNEVVTGYHRLIVPAVIPAGDYQIGIQLLDEDEEKFGEPLMLSHQMTITEPERIYEQPVFDVKSDYQWTNGLELLGYDLDASGEVRFIWGTSELITQNLRLFVHVLDENDLIVAQSDGIPVEWTRPTTSWIPEEYITTIHNFDVSVGEYDIRLGWYDPVSGVRVSVNDSDMIVLNDTLKIE
jgi:hypothetical protein